ncbi:MAG: hypothetical protein ABIO70_19955 [Pseudomonadota bacterium]
MRRKILVPAALLFALLTLPRCNLSIAIPEGKLERIAEGTLSVAHPMAGEFTGARVVGGSPGGCGSMQRYVDIETGYRGALTGKQYFMTVRYNVLRLDPCEVSTDVIADTGPIPPVLLDNAFASSEVGKWVCEELR